MERRMKKGLRVNAGKTKIMICGTGLDLLRVHGARELHAPWMADHRRKSRSDKLEVVASFCYLGDMLSAAGGCELSTTTRVKTAWKKFKDLLPVLSSRTSLSKHMAVCAERNAPCQRDLAIDKAKRPASAAK